MASAPSYSRTVAMAAPPHQPQRGPQRPRRHGVAAPHRWHHLLVSLLLVLWRMPTSIRAARVSPLTVTRFGCSVVPGSDPTAAQTTIQVALGVWNAAAGPITVSALTPDCALQSVASVEAMAAAATVRLDVLSGTVFVAQNADGAVIDGYAVTHRAADQWWYVRVLDAVGPNDAADPAPEADTSAAADAAVAVVAEASAEAAGGTPSGVTGSGAADTTTHAADAAVGADTAAPPPAPAVAEAAEPSPEAAASSSDAAVDAAEASNSADAFDASGSADAAETGAGEDTRAAAASPAAEPGATAAMAANAAATDAAAAETSGRALTQIAAVAGGLGAALVLAVGVVMVVVRRRRRGPRRAGAKRTPTPLPASALMAASRHLPLDLEAARERYRERERQRQQQVDPQGQPMPQQHQPQTSYHVLTNAAGAHPVATTQLMAAQAPSAAAWQALVPNLAHVQAQVQAAVRASGDGRQPATTHVAVEVDAPLLSAAPSSSLAAYPRLEKEQRYLVGHAFCGESPDEIDLEVGDLVHIHHVFSDGWAQASVVNRPGIRGMLPSTILIVPPRYAAAGR
ncbi:hypothetical protein CXG81DRAFT_17826 [Caulochytrium protostelioides]|uniref:SH3 domain-containing protein n=1 Tax=Caulochytrium protostelioides TaxID=1555241 RepID=A0A4P9XBN5_9FUNG|nr:hypothetical protein CXG81DRAFT_17826 [Caulochytrium protostelioides]|eukprot:RKP02550.1 hypothetical protein CXG81DRAFT_17826 [Caulochytrium protostelioides]